MNTSLYTVEFFGGPSDGLVLTDPHFNVRNKLLLPAVPACLRSGQNHCHELAGHWSTAYLLTSRHRALVDDHMTIYLTYDFLGYELLETKTGRESQTAPHWLSRLRHRLLQARHALARWMLAPIDHPLKMCHEPAKPRQHAASGRT
jgi:hypothetical protein